MVVSCTFYVLNGVQTRKSRTMLDHSRLFPWYRLWRCCGDYIRLIIPLIGIISQLFLWLFVIIPFKFNYSYDSDVRIEAGEGRARYSTCAAAVTTAPPRCRQPLIPLLRRHCLPETSRPLLRRSCLQKLAGGTIARPRPSMTGASIHIIYDLLIFILCPGSYTISYSPFMIS